MQSVIEVRHLSCLALENLSFKVGAGERVAVIGESGAGKSVLLGCLLGLNRPSGGEVRVFDAALNGRPLAAVGLGVAFQQPGLFDAWSVAENLRLASATHIDDSGLSLWLAKIGLSDINLQVKPGELSGGQQKRVALARALMRGTRLVVLDEPTSGLDPANVDRVCDLLNRHLSDHHPALLVVTHDYGLALSVCSRILRLSDGQLRDVTPPPTMSRVEAERLFLAEKPLDRGDSAPRAVAVSPAWRLSSLTMNFIVQGLPLSLLIMGLLGAMLVAQGAGISSIDVSRFVPRMIVVAVFRELSPLIVGLLMASRVGARMSAQLAGMAYTAQLDSMRALGLSPVRLLFQPFAIAAATAFPLCVLAGAGAALLAASQSAAFGWGGLTIGPRRFLDLAGDAFTTDLVISCVCKGFLMGLAVTAIAYRAGTTRIRSAPALGETVTLASVRGAVAVVLVDIAVSWGFFTGGHG